MHEQYASEQTGLTPNAIQIAHDAIANRTSGATRVPLGGGMRLTALSSSVSEPSLSAAPSDPRGTITLYKDESELNQQQDGGVSKVKLALGAASLFLFLVGLKRSFRRDDGSEVSSTDEQLAPEVQREPTPGKDKLRNAS